ncbi:uncharacterized protein EAE98_010089 [Botrytis deweyae]|uniref:DUF7587 domain-containing protein n=1 Tax=Botrytis deweyae TaxID=2478750 RepID=A0ABQ7I9P5_9HELO|nr:uncharacterized protein EAE98_010089 [Botrytis deweyae]KAF7917673.1 hypothetical protein EAE98_010089 [Botrytis deweyae]
MTAKSGSDFATQPSTPRHNPRNAFISTPDYTPPSLSPSPPFRFSANITSESDLFISDFRASSTTKDKSSNDSVASLLRSNNGSYSHSDLTLTFPRTAMNDRTTSSTNPGSEYVLTSFGNISISNNSILTRDRYDLNITRNPFHPHSQKLNLESEDLRTYYQTLQFYRKWTSHLISHLTGIPITRNLTSTSPDNFITIHSPSRTHSLKHDDPQLLPPRADHPNELTILTRQKNLIQENDLATSISQLEALIKHLLSLPLPHTPQNKNANTDTLLYRVHTATSQSTYSRSYGFRCSGWIDSLYTSGVTDERQADGRAFQSHCNRDKVPSPYISVSTSIARIMRLPECHKEKEAGSRVSVISLNRLRQLGIKAQSTSLYFDEFVYSSGGKISRKNGDKDHLYEDGVSYVTDTHWLVEEWIPDQAIVSEMDCEEFFKIADRGGINREVARKYPFKTELEALTIDLEKWPERYPGGKK